MVFLLLYVLFLALAAVHVAVRRQRLAAAGKVEVFFLYQLGAAGISLLMASAGHVLRPVPTAEAIGWPPHPQFQFELGSMELGLAVASLLGLVWRNRHYWLGVLIPTLVMMPLAGFLHVHEMLVRGNLAPYNTVIIGANFLGPLTQLALLLACFRLSRPAAAVGERRAAWPPSA